jgi:hypothetical protein
MAERTISPDERVLRLHLESGRFRSGVAVGRWRLVSIDWPYVTIAVTARDGIEYGFRFHCADYPRTAVTAQPWDIERNTPLPGEKWPTGRSRVPLAFNPNWKGGTCLYLPCDRQSIEGHDKWRHEHPALLWDPDKGLCKYLLIIHELLNSSDYGGRRVG